MKPTPLLVALCALAAPAFAAEELDVSKLYEVSTEGSTTKLGAGESGKLVLSIKLTDNVHVSDEAPMSIALSGTNGAEPSMTTLKYKDQTSKKAEGQKYVNPVEFSVPFTVKVAEEAAPVKKKSSKAKPAAPAAAGAITATIDAKMTFFICTEQLCARQQKQVSVPVQVCRGAPGTC